MNIVKRETMAARGRDFACFPFMKSVTDYYFHWEISDIRLLTFLLNFGIRGKTSAAIEIQPHTKYLLWIMKCVSAMWLHVRFSESERTPKTLFRNIF